GVVGQGGNSSYVSCGSVFGTCVKDRSVIFPEPAQIVVGGSQINQLHDCPGFRNTSGSGGGNSFSVPQLWIQRSIASEEMNTPLSASAERSSSSLRSASERSRKEA